MLQFDVHVGARGTRALLDSGATLNFASSSLVSSLGVDTRACAPINVTLATGTVTTCQHVVTLLIAFPGCEHVIDVDFHVLEGL